MAILRRIVCVSGFSQGLHRPTGLERLWLRLRELYECRQGLAESEVSLHVWNENWDHFADHILRTGPNDYRELDVRVVAYSWGAGRGFARLAKALDKRGVAVQAAVLSDPVYHSWFGLWRAIWSPIIGRPVIIVPPNVKKVYYLIQNTDTPHGHEVVAQDAKYTHVDPPLVLRGRTHAFMDDSPEFLDLAMKAML